MLKYKIPQIVTLTRSLSPQDALDDMSLVVFHFVC